MTLVYKIAPRALWRAAEEAGRFAGSPIDLTDGYIHFSARAQVETTAKKHFAGQNDLLLIAVEAQPLGENLKWERARDGELFPHLYGALDLLHVLWTAPLPLKADGAHDFSGIAS